jgi:alpha,alpha-trehalose phosphorylase
MRDHGGELSFSPRLPEAISRLAFRIIYQARRVLLEVTADRASYTLRAGESLDIRHHGQPATLDEGEPVVLEIPPAPPREAPSQPPGREPLTRRQQR